jgi:hypothetical protein
MEKARDSPVYSPSGGSNVVRADIVACRFKFQISVTSYVNRCNKSNEKGGSQSFAI